MKYRKWSLEEKLEILSSSEELGIVEACRKYSVSTGTFYSWIKKIFSKENRPIRKFNYNNPIQVQNNKCVALMG
jgi:transposase-like protein